MKFKYPGVIQVKNRKWTETHYVKDIFLAAGMLLSTAAVNRNSGELILRRRLRTSFALAQNIIGQNTSHPHGCIINSYRCVPKITTLSSRKVRSRFRRPQFSTENLPTKWHLNSEAGVMTGIFFCWHWLWIPLFVSPSLYVYVTDNNSSNSSLGAIIRMMVV